MRNLRKNSFMNCPFLYAVNRREWFKLNYQTPTPTLRQLTLLRCHCWERIYSLPSVPRCVSRLNEAKAETEGGFVPPIKNQNSFVLV